MIYLLLPLFLNVMRIVVLALFRNVVISYFVLFLTKLTPQQVLSHMHYTPLSPPPSTNGLDKWHQDKWQKFEIESGVPAPVQEFIRLTS